VNASSRVLLLGMYYILCTTRSSVMVEEEESVFYVQYHFVRDMVEENKVLLMKVDTLKNVANSLTKSVSIEKFSWCRGYMGITSLDC
jgi:hypothetical protein